VDTLVILLDNGPHCKTWEKKAVKNIAQDVLKHFPQNLLQPKIAPSYGETLSYAVQYKETAWQFLSRLSATYGEWLYYDGQKLVLGPPQGNKVKLVYGKNLHHFNMALQVRPASFQMMAYDYMNHEVYDGEPAGIASKAGLNELGKHTLQKSEQFYGTKPKQWHNHFLTNKKQLDDFVNTQAAMQTSNMVRFSGRSGHPAIQVGGLVNTEGKNVFTLADESFGEYTVISVNHFCDGQGNYSNDFVSIPSSVKMPPITNYTEPRSETQSAMVTDNHDPNGLGRVRVKFHWMNGSEKSPWIRVTTPHAGDGKGMFFIPETGEEVIVGFEGDSPTKPYIIGSVYHGKAKNSFASGGNDVKTFQSRSGNKMVLDDKAGSVFVEDKDGNSMKMDGAGKVDVIGKKSVTLTCGSAMIEMKEDGTVSINGKTITAAATDNATMGSGGASFVADGKKNEAVMGGAKAIVTGGAEATITSPKTTLNGDASASVKSSGPTSIEGAIVKLN
jgi:Rhs element Vgr protein